MEEEEPMTDSGKYPALEALADASRRLQAYKVAEERSKAILDEAAEVIAAAKGKGHGGVVVNLSAAEPPYAWWSPALPDGAVVVSQIIVNPNPESGR